MKNFILIPFLFLVAFGFAQKDEKHVDAMVSEITNSLKEKGIEDYFLRKDYCVGNAAMIKMPDGKLCISATTHFTVYIFWKEDDVTHIEKVDNCGNFTTVKLENTDLMTKVDSIVASIKENEVKPFKPLKEEVKPLGNMYVESCRKDFYFNLNGTSFLKKFKDLDVSDDGDRKNVNADYNGSLEIIKLDKELTTIINEEEAKALFVRI